MTYTYRIFNRSMNHIVWSYLHKNFYKLFYWIRISFKILKREHIFFFFISYRQMKFVSEYRLHGIIN